MPSGLRHLAARASCARMNATPDKAQSEPFCWRLPSATGSYLGLLLKLCSKGPGVSRGMGRLVSKLFWHAFSELDLRQEVILNKSGIHHARASCNGSWVGTCSSAHFTSIQGSLKLHALQLIGNASGSLYMPCLCQNAGRISSALGGFAALNSCLCPTWLRCDYRSHVRSLESC